MQRKEEANKVQELVRKEGGRPCGGRGGSMSRLLCMYFGMGPRSWASIHERERCVCVCASVWLLQTDEVLLFERGPRHGVYVEEQL